MWWLLRGGLGYITRCIRFYNYKREWRGKTMEERMLKDCLMYVLIDLCVISLFCLRYWPFRRAYIRKRGINSLPAFVSKSNSL